MATTRKATLMRGPSTDQGTFSDYVSDSGFACKIAELPWRDNKHDKSCIPPAPGASFLQVLMCWLWSNKHGRYCYHAVSVEGREDVEVHTGNLAGDVDLGFESDVQGCMLPGEEIVTFNAGERVTPSHAPLKQAQKGVSESHKALAALEKDMQDGAGNQVSFLLTINP